MYKNEELQKWLNDDRYVQKYQLMNIWGLRFEGVNKIFRTYQIKRIHHIFISGKHYTFFSKQECQQARPFTFKSEQLKKMNQCISNIDLISNKELAKKWNMSVMKTGEICAKSNIKIVEKFNLGGKSGIIVFYNKSECEKIIPDVQCIEDSVRLVTTGFLSNQWNMSAPHVNIFLKKNNITSKGLEKKKSGERRGRAAHIYDFRECLIAMQKHKLSEHELKKYCDNFRYTQRKELERLWRMTRGQVNVFLQERGIQPLTKFATNKGFCAFYDRAECERARPFINQPEKKVEKVEQIESLDIETRREEFEHEKNSALSDDEVKLIIGQCKDPIDKVMILSVLCFGIKTGELDLLNIDDINGDEISLQSPSGTIKMSISRQYKESLIDLAKFYKEKGWTVNDDTALFLNQSGVRMSRQGMNTRVKNISDKINIGREFTIGALRATFAQRIYKETNKNIGSVHKYLRLNDNTSVMSYLLDFQSKEQRIMPTELMNDVSTYCDNKEQKQMELPEPKEQMPDIIPADTIDLFTMSELESELKQRGVELTAEVKAKINASDMPEMQEIATMIKGNAKTIAIRLSVLNEIAGQLKSVKKAGFDYDRWKEETIPDWLKNRGEYKTKNDIRKQIGKIEEELFKLKNMLDGMK